MVSEKCNFCGYQSEKNDRYLIAGPEVFICDECALTCVKILFGKGRKELSNNKEEEKKDDNTTKTNKN